MKDYCDKLTCISESIARQTSFFFINKQIISCLSFAIILRQQIIKTTFFIKGSADFCNDDFDDEELYDECIYNNYVAKRMEGTFQFILQYIHRTPCFKLLYEILSSLHLIFNFKASFTLIRLKNTISNRKEGFCFGLKHSTWRP